MEQLNKTQTLRILVEQGERRGALSIAATFRMGLTRAQQAIIKKGYECHHFGDTYRQMGVDPEAAIEAAWNLLVNHPMITGAKA
jgi:hypothetical protein